MMTVTGDKDLLLYVGRIPNSLEDGIAREITLIMAELQTYIKENKLSGQALHERTGNLKNSLKNSITSAKDTIIGTITAEGVSSNNFPYGYVHEYNLGRYKDNKDHSYMRSSLAENEANILNRIDNVVKESLYGY